MRPIAPAAALTAAFAATLVGLLVCFAGRAAAQDDSGGPPDPCAFDWSLKREEAWFAESGLRRVAPGDTLAAGSPAAVLGLRRSTDADLPYPPTRPLKPGTYAGALRIDAPAAPGLYQITLSDEGWIDVIPDGGEPISSVAHTGKRHCPGLRKSLRFRLPAKPFVVEVSNALADTVRIAVAPAEEGR